LTLGPLVAVQPRQVTRPGDSDQPGTRRHKGRPEAAQGPQAAAVQPILGARPRFQRRPDGSLGSHVTLGVRVHRMHNPVGRPVPHQLIVADVAEVDVPAGVEVGAGWVAAVAGVHCEGQALADAQHGEVQLRAQAAAVLGEGLQRLQGVGLAGQLGQLVQDTAGNADLHSAHLSMASTGGSQSCSPDISARSSRTWKAAGRQQRKKAVSNRRGEDRVEGVSQFDHSYRLCRSGHRPRMLNRRRNSRPSCFTADCGRACLCKLRRLSRQAVGAGVPGGEAAPAVGAEQRQPIGARVYAGVKRAAGKNARVSEERALGGALEQQHAETLEAQTFQWCTTVSGLVMKYVRSNLDEDSEIGGSSSGIAGSGAGAIGTAGEAFQNVPTVTVPRPRASRLQRLRNYFRQRNYLEKFLFIAVCVLTILVLLLAAFLYRVTCPAPQHSFEVQYRKEVVPGPPAKGRNLSMVCLDPECISLSARILSYMNEAANPCEDFYEFACGSFRKRVAIRRARSGLQAEANEILLRSILGRRAADRNFPKDTNPPMPEPRTLTVVNHLCQLNFRARPRSMGLLGLRRLLELVATGFGSFGTGFGHVIRLYASCMIRDVSAREASGVQPVTNMIGIPAVIWSLGCHDIWDHRPLFPHCRIALPRLRTLTGRARPLGGALRQRGPPVRLLQRRPGKPGFLLAHTESLPFFTVDVEPDNSNSSRHVLCFGQARTILGVRENYVGNGSATNLAALSEALLSVAQLFNFNLTQSNVTDLIDLEKQIAQISLPESERRDSTKIITSTVRYLMDNVGCSSLQPLFDLTYSNLTQVNWLDFLARYASNVSYHITPDTPVNIRDENYLRQLCPLLQRLAADPQKKLTVNNYLLIRSVWIFLSVLNKEAAAIPRKLHHITDGVHGSPNPWALCVRSVSGMFGFGLGKLYVDQHFDDESKLAVNSMINDVKAAFNRSLQEAAWMDATTRRLAMAKLVGIRNLVGYPDYFGNETAMREEFGSFRFASGEYFNNLLKIQRLGHVKSIAKLAEPVKVEFEMTPQSINAYYSPSSNVIAFPAGILQRPFYQAQFPPYISYGAIGAVIGHEVTHGFDDDGKNFDRNGNQRQWWSNRTAQSFKEAAACIAKQYEDFVVDGDVRVPGQLAYKDRANLLPEPLLPNLNERFTKEQLLFIAYSQTWCELETKESVRQSAKVDPHPPGKMRVWGPISNNHDFGGVFKCPAGARMNPLVRQNGQSQQVAGVQVEQHGLAVGTAAEYAVGQVRHGLHGPVDLAVHGDPHCSSAHLGGVASAFGVAVGVRCRAKTAVRVAAIAFDVELDAEVLEVAVAAETLDQPARPLRSRLPSSEKSMKQPRGANSAAMEWRRARQHRTASRRVEARTFKIKSKAQVVIKKPRKLAVHLIAAQLLDPAAGDRLALLPVVLKAATVQRPRHHRLLLLLPAVAAEVLGRQSGWHRHGAEDFNWIFGFNRVFARDSWSNFRISCWCFSCRILRDGGACLLASLTSARLPSFSCSSAFSERSSAISRCLSSSTVFNESISSGRSFGLKQARVLELGQGAAGSRATVAMRTASRLPESSASSRLSCRFCLPAALLSMSTTGPWLQQQLVACVWSHLENRLTERLAFISSNRRDMSLMRASWCRSSSGEGENPLPSELSLLLFDRRLVLLAQRLQLEVGIGGSSCSPRCAADSRRSASSLAAATAASAASAACAAASRIAAASASAAASAADAAKASDWARSRSCSASSSSCPLQQPQLSRLRLLELRCHGDGHGLQPQTQPAGLRAHRLQSPPAADQRVTEPPSFTLHLFDFCRSFKSLLGQAALQLLLSCQQLLPLLLQLLQLLLFLLQLLTLLSLLLLQLLQLLLLLLKLLLLFLLLLLQLLQLLLGRRWGLDRPLPPEDVAAAADLPAIDAAAGCEGRPRAATFEAAVEGFRCLAAAAEAVD
uniref:Neprilysin n=1 Tax=Macrostomum lignano TaxID=282301 RepID=A0A1I8IK96_9PLAT